MRFFELSQNYRTVLDMIDENVDFEMVMDTLESLEEAIEDKAENTAKVIKSISYEVEAIKAEEKRLAERRRALENKVAYLKEYLQTNLEVAGLTKIKGKLFTVGIQNNPPSVIVHDTNSIPRHYFIDVEPQLDKTALKKVLQSGVTVDGAELVQTQSIRIR